MSNNILEIKECYADYDIHDEVVVHYGITLNCNLKCKYCIRIAKEELESDVFEFLSLVSLILIPPLASDKYFSHLG